MVESIEYLFREGIVGPVSYLFDPGRRIAWVYLLISDTGLYMVYVCS